MPLRCSLYKQADCRMLDTRQARRSPRHAPHGSENKFEGAAAASARLSPIVHTHFRGLDRLKTSPAALAAARRLESGNCSSSSMTSSSESNHARAPLTAANNGGDPSPPRPQVSRAAAAADAAGGGGLAAPSSSMFLRKQASSKKPGVSRFGFKPPPGTSLSPRRPGAGVTADGDSSSGSNRGILSRISPLSLLPMSPKRLEGSDASDVIDARPATVVAKVRSARSRSRTTTTNTPVSTPSTRSATASANANSRGPTMRGAGGATGTAGAGSLRNGRRPAAGMGTGRTATRSAPSSAAARRTSMVRTRFGCHEYMCMYIHDGCIICRRSVRACFSRILGAA